IIQKAGIISASANRAAARAFLQFLTSAAGHAVFERFGFE
ncbi:MAG: substrate-binding domain-containing protein, partial [Acidobacteriaceae bacterium]|nr:substrate-binding domain-containing protein [Acidobacteriaceae bacterium]